MTNLQIRLVAEIGRTGSISTAAEKLQISQPNASSSLRKLEEELGCTLFLRGRSGITLTDEGKEFLKHSTRLLREYEALENVRDHARSTRLRVGIMACTLAVDAFIEFCNQHSDSKEADLICVTVSFPEGIRMLYLGDLDVLIGFATLDGLEEVKELSAKGNCLFKIHQNKKVCVRLRKNHPLLKDGTFDGTKASLALLKNYPHVDYRQMNALLEDFRAQTSVSIPCSYRIYVDERDSRLKMIGKTDAYSLGIDVSEDLQKRYGIVNIPLASTKAVLYSVVRQEDREEGDIVSYLGLVDQLARQ